MTVTAVAVVVVVAKASGFILVPGPFNWCCLGLQGKCKTSVDASPCLRVGAPSASPFSQQHERGHVCPLVLHCVAPAGVSACPPPAGVSAYPPSAGAPAIRWSL
jgi:hypothetical protein